MWELTLVRCSIFISILQRKKGWDCNKKPPELEPTANVIFIFGEWKRLVHTRTHFSPNNEILTLSGVYLWWYRYKVETRTCCFIPNKWQKNEHIYNLRVMVFSHQKKCQGFCTFQSVSLFQMVRVSFSQMSRVASLKFASVPIVIFSIVAVVIKQYQCIEIPKQWLAFLLIHNWEFIMR